MAQIHFAFHSSLMSCHCSSWNCIRSKVCRCNWMWNLKFCWNPEDGCHNASEADRVVKALLSDGLHITFSSADLISTTANALRKPRASENRRSIVIVIVTTYFGSKTVRLLGPLKHCETRFGWRSTYHSTYHALISSGGYNRLNFQQTEAET